MNLRDIFKQYTKDELKIICMNLKIPGYGGLDKRELVDLLYQSTCNREFIMDLFTSLSDFCAYFLSLIPKTGRKETMDEGKTSGTPSFSLQAMNDSLKQFYMITQIFLREDENNNAILVIPDDIEPFFKEFLES